MDSKEPCDETDANKLSSNITVLNRQEAAEIDRRKLAAKNRGVPGSSCDPCRKQHRACDGNRPCGRCIRNNRVDICKFGPVPASSGGSSFHSGSGIPSPIVTDRLHSSSDYRNSHVMDQISGNRSNEMLQGQNAIHSHPLSTQPSFHMAHAKPPQHNSSTNSTDDDDDERLRLHRELQSLAHALDNLQSQLSPKVTAESPADICQPASGLPKLDPIFLRDSLWFPPSVPMLYATDGTTPHPGKIMTLVESKDDPNESSGVRVDSSKKSPTRKFVRRLYPRALRGTTVGYSSSELANLQFAKDLLAYFGGDCNNVSVGQHAQVVVYRETIIYVNKEFMDLVRSPYENVIGRSLDDFVPEAFLQYHNFVFHKELLASGSSTIAFETVLARLDRTCFRCVLGMSLMKNADGKLVQKVCTVYLNTVQDVEIPPGKTPVPYMETDYDRKIEYECLPKAIPGRNFQNSEEKFPLYFAKACYDAKAIREGRLTSRKRSRSDSES